MSRMPQSRRYECDHRWEETKFIIDSPQVRVFIVIVNVGHGFNGPNNPRVDFKSFSTRLVDSRAADYLNNPSSSTSYHGNYHNTHGCSGSGVYAIVSHRCACV